MEKLVLLADFGSTFSKFIVVDLVKVKLIKKLTLPTFAEADLMDCYSKATEQLCRQLEIHPSDFSEQFFCSSAWGGFKMVAIGLTESLTVEAAKRAALGAGTRILKNYHYKLNDTQVQEITELAPDIILLSGGTDGGNQEVILHNALLLSQLLKDTTVLVAGNQQANDKICQLFKHSSCTLYLSENVMPKVNVLNVEPVRAVARTIFMNKIIEAEGLNQVAKFASRPIIPTPTAVLEAAKLLAKETATESGLGDLALLDIGGATTDVYSIGKGLPADEQTFFEGLAEPLSKRTVEGDLGMRSSSMSVAEQAGIADLQAKLSEYWSKQALIAACRMRIEQPAFIPLSTMEKELDQLLAFTAGDLAMSRHAGTIKKETTPTRTIYRQKGKDLRNFQTLIGTGGVIVHSDEPKQILSSCLQTRPENLKLQQPQMFIDQHYILSTLGVLAQAYPQKALQLMKELLRPL